jgi:CrcB protein
MKWVAVFIGGGLGSVFRFALSMLLPMTGIFPWSTLLANGIAAGLLAWLFSIGIKTNNDLLWQLAAVGFCGGLSTFSTFSLETIQLFRSGQTGLAWLNIALSILLSLGLFYFISHWFQRG